MSTTIAAKIEGLRAVGKHNIVNWTSSVCSLSEADGILRSLPDLYESYGHLWFKKPVIFPLLRPPFQPS